jgi:hypothetical protein
MPRGEPDRRLDPGWAPMSPAITHAIAAVKHEVQELGAEHLWRDAERSDDRGVGEGAAGVALA